MEKLTIKDYEDLGTPEDIGKALDDATKAIECWSEGFDQIKDIQPRSPDEKRILQEIIDILYSCPPQDALDDLSVVKNIKKKQSHLKPKREIVSTHRCTDMGLSFKYIPDDNIFSKTCPLCTEDFQKEQDVQCTGTPFQGVSHEGEPEIHFEVNLVHRTCRIEHDKNSK